MAAALEDRMQLLLLYRELGRQMATQRKDQVRTDLPDEQRASVGNELMNSFPVANLELRICNFQPSEPSAGSPVSSLSPRWANYKEPAHMRKGRCCKIGLAGL